VFGNPAGEESGYCGAPLRIGKGQVFCNGKFNINQDLTTVYPTNNLYGIPHVFIFQANTVLA
jgi:hypothetical protein